MTNAKAIDGRAAFFCPVDAALSVIGGKYKGRILWHLDHEGVLRFSQIQKSVPQATHKMLANQLHELESDGLITRTVYPVVPPKTEYAITEYGRSVHTIIDAMYDWGIEYVKRSGKVLLPLTRWSDEIADSDLDMAADGGLDEELDEELDEAVMEG